MSRQQHATHRPRSAPWPERLALFGVIAVPIGASIAARIWLVPHLLHWVSRVAQGSPAWMFTAGWATAGFAPAAALIFLLDGNRRERQLGDDPLNRPRAVRGHAVPGRGSGYWIRRAPLILALLVAVVFAPARAGGGPVIWHDKPGADAFRDGWHLSFLISLAALVTLLAFRLLAMLPGHGDRLLRVAGPVAAVAPALALFGLYTSTR